MTDRAPVRVEEIVRALCAAAAALRLYPPTSEIPAQAIAHAAAVAADVTAHDGPSRFTVDPKAFKHGDQVIGENVQQISTFAETLYAHQVGQLIVAPGLTEEEIASFLRCASAEPSAVREEGGLRSVLVTAGVSHLAVIELTLRASTEEGLAGIDLTSAPLEVIGPAVVRAAADWARTAAGGEGHDQVAESIDKLESAARDLASSRIAEAMARLDEQTRSAVLAAATRADGSGKDMKGMLSVIAGMKPATLARLLTLAATRTGTDPASVLARLELSPEAARAVMLLLRSSPRSETESGVPSTVDIAGVAAAAVEENEDDEERIRAQVAAASLSLAAGRGLRTALALAGGRRTVETVTAIGDALGPAMSAGAFEATAQAVALLSEATEDPALETAVRKARLALADVEVLARAATHIRDDATAEAAGPLFAAAGAIGAESLLKAWATANGARRVAVEAALRLDADQVLVVAGRRVRAGDVTEACDVIGLLGRTGDRRAAPVLAQALEHPAPEVRAVAVEALAKMNTPDSWRVVASAIHHPDEATARRALYEVRMASARSAVPDLIAALSSPRSSRSWGFKREVVDCLKELQAVEAVPALKREAGHIFAFTAKRRMLRQAARDALDAIRAQADQGTMGTGGGTR